MPKRENCELMFLTLSDPIWVGDLETEQKNQFFFSSPLILIVFNLKGPKHEIFESGFFTETRPVRIGDLGTGEKK